MGTMCLLPKTVLPLEVPGESPVFVNLPVLMVDPSSLHFHMPVALSEFWLYVDNLVSSPHLRTDAASSQIHE